MILPAYLANDRAAPHAQALQQAADLLRAGQLLGLPTETVYGLGADADNASAVAAIFTAKGRPSDHPLIVHIASADGGMSGVAHYAAQVPAFAQQLMAAFWPGPLTLILPRRAGVATACAGGQDSIGLRCPAHPVAQALLNLLRQAGAGQAPVWGIAAPSANRFGRISPTTAQHVHSELGDAVPGGLTILDGGPCAVGIESTIIDCTRGTPILLRPGAITRDQIAAACGQMPPTQKALNHAQAAPRASGTLESHYAPRATLRLMDAATLQAAIDARTLPQPNALTDTAAPPIALYVRSRLVLPPAHTALLHPMPTDAEAAAKALFADLRTMDAKGVREIWVETPPADQAWEGVRDRLQRAAASRDTAA